MKQFTPCQRKYEMSVDNSHRTAIRRNRMSLPMRWLTTKGYIKGRTLDYGCGHGQDADLLHLDKFDPHFFPEVPEGKYDTIVCNYVLNVLPAMQRWAVIEKVLKLLLPGGKAFFSVRRDIDGPTHTSKGTFQDKVELDFPNCASIRHKKGSYEIYQVDYCQTCDEIGSGFGPSHCGSIGCESHSIASGGNRSHCTCDRCF